MARAKLVVEEQQIKKILGLREDVDIRAMEVSQDPMSLMVVFSHDSIPEDWKYPEGVGAESRIYVTQSLPAEVLAVDA